MLKDQYIIILFIGFLLIYLNNKPPKVILKKRSIDKMTNVKHDLNL